MKSIFYTHISPLLLQKRRNCATFFGFIGLLPLFFSSLWLFETTLHWAGPILVLFWIAINFPFIQRYTSLRKIDRSPQKITLSEEGLVYRGFSIPIDAISHFDYREKGDLYGLAIEKKEGKSIFLPYYNKKCCQELQARLQDIVELDEAN